MSFGGFYKGNFNFFFIIFKTLRHIEIVLNLKPNLNDTSFFLNFVLYKKQIKNKKFISVTKKSWAE